MQRKLHKVQCPHFNWKYLQLYRFKEAHAELKCTKKLLVLGVTGVIKQQALTSSKEKGKKKFHALQGTKPTLAAGTVAVIMINLVPMLEIFFLFFCLIARLKVV